MGRLLLGLAFIVIGILMTIYAIARGMSPGGGIDVYNNVALYNHLAFVYNAIRWTSVGLMLMVAGATLTIIGFIKK
jgi:hypothetical protein